MEFVWRFAALTLCFLILCRLISRFTEKKLSQEQANISDVAGRFQSFRVLQCFVAGSLAIALLGVLIDLVGLFDRPFAAGLLRFYWFRTADIIVPLGTALSAAFWIELQMTAKALRGTIALAVAFIAIAWHCNAYISPRMYPVPARGDINMINAMLITQPDQPSPSKAARLENLVAWQDACRWIRENTPADARFFTPRLSQTFKWYARRAEVATWKDVPQDAASLIVWWDRIQDLFATGSTQPEFRWRESVTDMEPKRLAALAEKYQADYIVALSGSPRPGWKVIYETQGNAKNNKGYAVYHLEREPGP
jgi:hypothetical protein